MNRLEQLAAPRQSVAGRAILLYDDGNHQVHWVGIADATAFRCNAYLIVDGDEALLVDPGSRGFYPQVKEAVAGVVDPARVNGLILSHQDPDVCASLKDWYEANPDLQVFTSPRTQVLLPHYDVSGYEMRDVEVEPEYTMEGGGQLQFVGAPFLHSPMAFATFDRKSGFLFSGDVFAAIDTSWQLVVADFEAHRAKMDLFHLDYMASHVATRGFARRLKPLPITAILPQHGSIIPEHFVPDAIRYLDEMQCGLDAIYPDLL